MLSILDILSVYKVQLILHPISQRQSFRSLWNYLSASKIWVIIIIMVILLILLLLKINVCQREGNIMDQRNYWSNIKGNKHKLARNNVKTNLKHHRNIKSKFTLLLRSRYIKYRNKNYVNEKISVLLLLHSTFLSRIVWKRINFVVCKLYIDKTNTKKCYDRTACEKID